MQSLLSYSGMCSGKHTSDPWLPRNGPATYCFLRFVSTRQLGLSTDYEPGSFQCVLPYFFRGLYEACVAEEPEQSFDKQLASVGPV